MAYFDVLRDVCNELDTNSWVEPDGDNGGDLLWVESWDELREINQALKVKFNEMGIADQIKHYRSDEDDYDTSYVDFATDDNWVFQDESFLCDNCYQVYRNSDYYANYAITDGAIFCEDCVKEDSGIRDEYISSLVNNPKRANTILSEEDLEDAGFMDFRESDYASGWYDRHDSPNEILDGILEEYPEAEVVFSINKTYNPWETSFKVYVNLPSYDRKREKRLRDEESDDYED